MMTDRCKEGSLCSRSLPANADEGTRAKSITASSKRRAQAATIDGGTREEVGMDPFGSAVLAWQY